MNRVYGVSSGGGGGELWGKVLCTGVGEGFISCVVELFSMTPCGTGLFVGEFLLYIG